MISCEGFQVELQRPRIEMIPWEETCQKNQNRSVECIGVTLLGLVLRLDTPLTSLALIGPYVQHLGGNLFV